jgi:hypothetical protein
MRTVGLARAVGRIGYDAEIGLDHSLRPGRRTEIAADLSARLMKGAATALDRPHDAAVNVFFALAAPPTYQCRACNRSMREKNGKTRHGETVPV